MKKGVTFGSPEDRKFADAILAEIRNVLSEAVACGQKIEFITDAEVVDGEPVAVNGQRFATWDFTGGRKMVITIAPALDPVLGQTLGELLDQQKVKADS